MKSTQHLPWALCALALGGCPSSPEPAADLRPADPPADLRPADPPADLAEDPGEAVEGTAVDTHLLGDSERVVPRDLSGETIEVLVQRGPGGFDRYPGAGKADGSFRVARLPRDLKGPYYLRLGADYVLTTARRLDLGRARLGRPDAKVAKGGTQLTFDLKGLSPYQAGDFLELLSPGAGAYIFGFEYYSDQGVAIGSTEAKDLVIDYLDASTGERPYLFDGDRGDRVTLWQMVSRKTMAGVEYQAAGRVLRLPALGQKDGEETVLAGTMEDLPQSETADLSWRRAAYEAHRTSLVPGTSATDAASVTLLAEPGGKAHGVSAGYGDLVFGPQGKGPGDVQGAGIAYGNPFPAAWTQLVTASIASSTSYSVGTARRMLLNARMSFAAEKAAFVAAEGKPLVGPPRSPKVADKDLFGDAAVTGVGTSPRLTWDAPALGAPSGYIVSLQRLEAVSARTVSTSVATFYVPAAAERALTVPPGLLMSGETYHLRIQAVAGPGADLGAAPLRRALPWGSGDVLTRPFSP